jgi:hypothetical protein
MTALFSLIASVLPGARSIRRPLLAGLLWAVSLWVALADQVPTRADAGGKAQQIYDLIDYLGVPATVLLAASLTFVLGVLATFGTDLVRRLFGGLQTTRSDGGIAWHFAVLRRRRELTRSLKGFERDLTRIQIRTAQGDESAQGRLSTLNTNVRSTKVRLQDLGGVRFPGGLRSLRTPSDYRSNAALRSRGGQVDRTIAS